MNKIIELITIVIMMAIFITIILTAIYFISEVHSQSCLDSYAEKYCTENNLSVWTTYSIEFYCKDNGLGEHWRTGGFKFLEEELEDCKIKERFTFRKIKIKTPTF